MYFATADKSSRGSTKLHLDMTSAVNCMAYTVDDPDSGESGADWIIFDPEDTPRLRQYLRRRLGLLETDYDPIHAQQTFVDTEMLKELQEEGVYSYRFRQLQNQAVFIPAGAAHQVQYQL